MQDMLTTDNSLYEGKNIHLVYSVGYNNDRLLSKLEVNLYSF